MTPQQTYRGNIRHAAWATRSKEYVWDTLADVFPRHITPTDVDALIEINGCFFGFEGKTVGTQVELGQGRCLKRMIERWPESTAVVVVGVHPPLDRVDTAGGIIRCHYAWNDNGLFRWATDPIAGAGCLWLLASFFVEDAGTGRLNPSAWPARIAHAGRPFVESERQERLL